MFVRFSNILTVLRCAVILSIMAELVFINLIVMANCLSPLRLPNNSVYQNDFVSFTSNVVPCGKCDACRQSLQDSWVNRLTCEFSYFEKIRGNVVFLTFTFNEYKLPRMRIPIGKRRNGKTIFKTVPCFSAKIVRSFLNILHVRFYEMFGDSEYYKHYLCSEYGKNTKRPHHHGLFFLSPGVDVAKFCLLVKRLWAKKYGWMYPYIEENKPWLIARCLVRSKGKCAKYASKYATKDLAYFKLPYIDSYLKNYFPRLTKGSEEYKFIKDCLPKHWISKGLGASFLNDLNENEKLKLLVDGYYNEFTGKYSPLTRYVKTKLLYYYDKNKYPRVSPTTGKPIYSRFPTDFFRKYSNVVYNQQFLDYRNNVVYPLFSDPVSTFQGCLSSGLDYRKIRALVKSIPDYAKDTFIDDITNFHLVLYHIPLEYIVDSLVYGTADKLPWSTSFCSDLWFKNKDIVWLHDNEYHEESLDDYITYLTDELNISRYSTRFFFEVLAKKREIKDIQDKCSFDNPVLLYFTILLEIDEFLCDYIKWKSKCNTEATLKRLSDCEQAMLAKCRYPIKYC